MEKIRCMMEKKETRMMLLAIVGLVMFHMAICMLKNCCMKKKKQCENCEEC